MARTGRTKSRQALGAGVLVLVGCGLLGAVVVGSILVYPTALQIYTLNFTFYLALVSSAAAFGGVALLHGSRQLRARGGSKEGEISLAGRSGLKFRATGALAWLGVTLFALVDALGVKGAHLISDMPLEVFGPAVVFFLGGLAWIAVLAGRALGDAWKHRARREKQARHGTGELPSRSRARTGVVLFACTTCLALASSGVVFALGESWIRLTRDEFSAPAYALPAPGAVHFNTALDDPARVNQTLLVSLERGLWAMTKTQRRGGFPLGCTADGTRAWSDRPELFALYPGEFSLQGGTAVVGTVYLDAYALEPNPAYLDVAEAVGDALLVVQDPVTGGFGYEGRRHPDGTGYHPHPHNYRRAAILDDDVMQSCLRYLLDLHAVTNAPRVLAGIERGFDCLFAMEVPGGGWPQRSNFPPGSYATHVTLNDNALYDVVQVMLQAHRQFPNESRYLAAAKRAGAFLVRVQGNGGSPAQQGWAQQYDRADQPAWARHFEPPALCSAQTARAIDLLVDLYLVTGNASWLGPVPAAVAWLNASSTRLRAPLEGTPGETWARLYELGTNDPIYGLMRGGPRSYPQYTKDASAARPGYGWEGTYGIPGTLARYQQLATLNFSIEAFTAATGTTSPVGTPDPAAYLPAARAAHAAQADSGFWIEGDAIVDQVFARHARALIQYLHAATGTGTTRSTTTGA